jgi:transcription elongation factor
VNNSLTTALENTIVSIDTPESLINSYILRARNYSTILISQREIYEDAESSINTLKKIEDEKISQIISKIEEQKAKIVLVESNNTLIITDNSVELTESEKELQVQKLKSEIEILNAGVQTLTTRLSTLYKSK